MIYNDLQWSTMICNNLQRSTIIYNDLQSRFRVLSAEAKSLALSVAKLKDGELQEDDDRQIKAQNQVRVRIRRGL